MLPETVSMGVHRGPVITQEDPMPIPSYTLLYVDSPPASAAFYAGLLGREPVESAPTFALFLLNGGAKLGLWSRHTVEPAATAAGGGCEIGFSVADAATVETIHDDWRGRGLPILQPPTAMDFGHSFVALDPDGHRLRVFALTV
jgi:catechol 2,3-dioxygenase-like lactoylglutathione lyase family enzyme